MTWPITIDGPILDEVVNAYVFPERGIGVSPRRFIGLARKYRLTLRRAGDTLLMGFSDFNELAKRVEAEKTTIYFIQMGIDGPIKIGKTDNSPEARLGELQCGNPYRLSIFYQFRDHAWKEHEIHAQLDDHRLEGEWFERDAALAWLSANRSAGV